MAWAQQMLLLRAGGTLSDTATHRLVEGFAAEDPIGKLQVVWKVKEQLRALLRTDALADTAVAEEELKILVEAAGRPETNKLYRTVCPWWKEIEDLIVTDATTGEAEANNTGIKHIKRTARGYANPGNYKSVILMRSAVRTAA
jgi:transposase